MERLQFQKKAAGILKVCAGQENVIYKEEVERYFAEEQLSEEQMEAVFDYLLSQKVIVKGYVKTGGSVRAAEEEEKAQETFTAEEEQYLRAYEADLEQMPAEDMLGGLLKEVMEMAKGMHRQEVFLGDLIQEGSIGLMLSRQQGGSEEDMLLMAKQSMQTLLESQSEVKLQDKKMADKVNQLDEEIRKLTEEMGRKVSVDELTEFLNITEEEVGDILRLAGEEIPEE